MNRLFALVALWFAALAPAHADEAALTAQVLGGGVERGAVVKQQGESNRADVTQLGGAEAMLLQRGRGNVATVTQNGAGPGDAVAWVYQNGEDNSVILNQSGADNRATLSQTGAANVIDLTQAGDDNAAQLTQNGVGFVLAITQLGGASIIINQGGP